MKKSREITNYNENLFIANWALGEKGVFKSSTIFHLQCSYSFDVSHKELEI